MRWDNVIFAYLFIAYMIFITLRGELPIYMGFLLSSASSTASTTSATTATSATSANATAVSNLGGMLSTVKTIAPALMMG